MNTCALGSAANDGTWQPAGRYRRVDGRRLRHCGTTCDQNADETLDTPMSNVSSGLSGLPLKTLQGLGRHPESSALVFCFRWRKRRHISAEVRSLCAARSGSTAHENGVETLDAPVSTVSAGFWRLLPKIP
jgi:hypothetical protein